MGCTQQSVSYSESTVVRASNNLWIPHPLTCPLLAFFCQSRNQYFGRGRRANTVSVGCSKKFHKII